ncbi:MAG: phospholipid/cholesterol/gamma-HCH transport system substrate-binding protein [Actinomycetota bacterium]|jgi:phospholipid/cholesterol/gamma-HCH transport system substrate-binding protein|nr:phospholipid/cholesterol/gamma-HCH transport system substrate-binding protein [Actinomycetota bacterium]
MSRLRDRRVLAGIAALLVVLAGLFVFRSGNATKTATAYFPKAIHVYKGSEVVVLGVRVGTVTRVHPEGTQVRVDFEYDASQRIPADAFAVFVEPTLVADRALQLAPVYDSGPVLPDHAVIPLARTEVPIELDDFNRNLSRLAAALGPRGANKDGAVSRAVQVGADNLRGEGAALNSTVTHVSELMSTLDTNKEALFDTVRNLQLFSTTLAQHDAETRSFTTDLAKVTAQLDGERDSFTAAVHEVGVSLDEVTRFVKDNRQLVATDLAELSRVTTILAKERVLLAHIADIGAVGVGNYPHMYTPSARTYNARFDNNDRQDNPALFVCQLYESVGGSPQQCLTYLAPLKDLPIPPRASR